MNRFIRLVQKDWRVNRVVVVGLVLAGVMPYLIGSAALFWERHEYWLLHRSGSTWGGGFSIYPAWTNYMENASGPAMLFTALLATVFDGVAFAQERRDRSAEFLAMLPARRSQIVCSKLLVAAACVLGAMAIHGGIAAACATRQSHWIQYLLRDLSQFWIASVGLFGIAWLFSTFLNSPAIAASISIGACCFVLGYVAVFAATGGRGDEILAIAMMTYLGVAGVLVGSVYYMRRIAP